MEREGTMQAEAALVRAAQAGSRAAFDHLVARHAAALVRTAYVILGDQDDAEDVTQESLIAAYRSLSSYHHDAPFGAWLHRIAVNRSYDYLRRRQRQSTLRAALSAVAPVAADDDAVRQARTNAHYADVRELIADLDPTNRAIVALRFLEDQPIKEIAVALDLPEGTVKRRLHEVLRTLRARLTEGAR